MQCALGLEEGVLGLEAAGPGTTRRGLGAVNGEEGRPDRGDAGRGGGGAISGEGRRGEAGTGPQVAGSGGPRPDQVKRRPGRRSTRRRGSAPAAALGIPGGGGALRGRERR